MMPGFIQQSNHVSCVSVVVRNPLSHLADRPTDSSKDVLDVGGRVGQWLGKGIVWSWSRIKEVRCKTIVSFLFRRFVISPLFSLRSSLFVPIFFFSPPVRPYLRTLNMMS